MSDENEEKKSLMLFGRDVSKIPCFRSSLLYGIWGGLSFGLAHFLFTSRSARSVNYSIYAFSMISMGCWIRCRYEYSKTKFEMLKMQELLRQQAIFEGSQQEIELDKKIQAEVVEV